MMAPLWNIVWLTFKTIRNKLVYYPATPLLSMNIQKLESRNFRYLYTNFHSSIIHNIQEIELIQMSANEQIGKKNVECRYNTVLLSVTGRISWRCLFVAGLAYINWDKFIMWREIVIYGAVRVYLCGRLVLSHSRGKNVQDWCGTDVLWIQSFRIAW